LTISHVKETSRSFLPEALSYITSWQQKIKNILKLELELGEQDTVISVYKTSLSNDENSLFQGFSDLKTNIESVI
jgi:hypothetical protein